MQVALCQRKDGSTNKTFAPVYLFIEGVFNVLKQADGD